MNEWTDEHFEEKRFKKDHKLAELNICFCFTLYRISISICTKEDSKEDSRASHCTVKEPTKHIEMFLGAIPKTEYIKVLQNIEKLYVMEEALHLLSTLTPSQIAVEI